MTRFISLYRNDPAIISHIKEELTADIAETYAHAVSYFGFTPQEVEMLAAKYDMDFGELEKWYDGYQIGDQKSIFNPNSVMEALMRHRCRNYWTKTAAYNPVATYIQMDLGYLSFDWNKEECYLPNREVADEMERALNKYNDENSLACVISLAFYAARNDFHVHREYQTDEGYADLVLIHYPEKIQDYTGIVLLVGITYNRGTKTHECCIERFAKL